MPNVKSHSKYIIKKKHQLINNGAIFERDFSTVGGITKFPSAQKPYYHSGNFVVTVNTSQVTPKRYTNTEWESNENGDTWTLNDLKQINKTIPNANKIVLKQDNYNLRDFAYFGSCIELIRASINDIIKRFPGELYSPTVNGSGILVKKSNINDKENQYLQIENGKNVFFINNPFNIDIHSSILTDEQKQNIKYVQEHYEKYEVIYEGEKYKIINIENEYFEEDNQECWVDKYFQKIIISYGVVNDDDEPYKEGDFIIYCFKGSDSNVIYLTQITNIAIRPLNDYYESFMSSLDTFQQLLLNRDSKPLYSTLFKVLEETDYGYNSKYERFTFPLGFGGYNLGIDTTAYSTYISKLYEYAEFYDEHFCGNLYRQMTHESIKNFDYSREFDENKEEYEIGGDKIQKILQVFGRELDEIKFYVDSIKDCNQITYNESNNLPDYFLTDTLDIEGWDVKNILPSNSNILIPSSNSDKEYNVLDINHRFFKNLKLNSRHILRKKGTIQSIEDVLSLFGLKSSNWAKGEGDYSIKEYIIEVDSIIDSYDDDKEMFYIDWCNYNKTIVYDTDEYRSGKYVPYQGLPIRYKQVYGYYYKKNNKKTFLTDNQLHDIIYTDKKMYIIINGRSYDVFHGANENKRLLFPYFSNDMIIDGNPYYQMYGGWMKNGELYNDTATQVPIVNNIYELFSISSTELYDGVIYEVKKIKSNTILIDDVLYNVLKNEKNEDCIKIKIKNESFLIGRTPFAITDSITITDGVINEETQFIEIKINTSSHRTINITDEDDVFDIPYFILNNNKMGNYFKLLDINKKHSLEGWEQINNNVQINNLKRYYKGNNPHKGNFIYDDGKEYLRYFQNIFKHAYDNDLFEKTFDKDNVFKDENNNEKLIGFNVLTEELINNCKVEKINLSESRKIDYFTSNDESDANVNVKNVQITFFMPKDKEIEFTKEEYVKYIDNVILHYLSQVIPNNTILEIKYE